MRKINLLLFVIGVLLNSCLTERAVEESIVSIKTPIEYLHDSKITKTDKKITIYNWDVINKSFNSKTIVVHENDIPVKTSNNFTRYIKSYKAELGQSTLETNYSEFLVNALEKESARTGRFNFDRQIGKANNYQIELSLDTCLTTGKYNVKPSQQSLPSIIINDSVNVDETLSPAETKLSIFVKILKSNNIVFQKRYSINHICKTPKVYRYDMNFINTLFVANLTESLSLSTKEFVETLVKDINENVVIPISK